MPDEKNDLQELLDELDEEYGTAPWLVAMKTVANSLEEETLVVSEKRKLH